MGNIIVLDENTSNKIAAGEVIERPASVIKELVENSIDAGASLVTVEIRNGGISYMKIIDNGSGIEEDDVEIAFERHATSKIRSSVDLDSISTLGFRGEALSSIAAVSSVELTSRVKKNPHGMYIKIQGGDVKEVKPTGCPVGTTFIIRDLFFNTPARFKFLKKDSTEAGYISDILSRIALGNPHISIKLISNNSTVIHTPGNNDLLSTIFSIYGKETAKYVLPLNYKSSKISISGYVGKPEIARANRNQQSVFLNNRFIKSKIVTSAIDEAFKTFLMKNKYPFIVMNLEINPAQVDINVHPTKMEVRFSEEQEIFRSVYHSVNDALLGKDLTKEVQLSDDVKEDFKFKDDYPKKPDYSQQKLSFNDSFIKERNSVKYETQSPVNTFTQVNTSEINEIIKKADVKEESEAAPSSVIKDAPSADNQKIEMQNQNNEFTEKNQEESDQKTSGSFSDYLIVGQAFSTYIILQHEDELVLIDQHAAHERIMYERLRKKHKNRESLSQMLLAPLVIELTHKEIKFLEEEKEFFSVIGFNFENFGNNSIILRTVPIIIEKNELKDSFLEILDHVIKSTSREIETEIDETLYTIACKAAVKANMKLAEIEIKNLLKDLDMIENPYTCPHGRPTAIKITKQELEKKFKRIV